MTATTTDAVDVTPSEAHGVPFRDASGETHNWPTNKVKP
jgi:hypothetical protein